MVAEEWNMVSTTTLSLKYIKGDFYNEISCKIERRKEIEEQ